MQIWLTILSLVISFLLGCQCSHLAKRKGRDPTVWFMVGAFFGIFGLLVILFLPARKSIKLLTVPTVPEPPFEALSLLHAEKFWYFLDEKKTQYGPMSFSALKTAWNKGTIQEKTFVWNEEMDNWKPLKEVVRL